MCKLVQFLFVTLPFSALSLTVTVSRPTCTQMTVTYAERDIVPSSPDQRNVNGKLCHLNQNAP
jgi:hypothetical protein